MTDYNHKITNGSTIRGEHLKLLEPRQSITQPLYILTQRMYNVMSMAKVMPLSKCA